MANPFRVKRYARVIFDTTGTDSAAVANTTVAAHPTTVFIPSGALITDVLTDVTTTFTSGTSAATIALHVEGANDVIAAVAINSGTTMWNAGRHAGLVGLPNPGADAAHDSQVEWAALNAATVIKTTASRAVTFTVAVEALTAGRLVAYIGYLV